MNITIKPALVVNVNGKMTKEQLKEFYNRKNKLWLSGKKPILTDIYHKQTSDDFHSMMVFESKKRKRRLYSLKRLESIINEFFFRDSTQNLC